MIDCTPATIDQPKKLVTLWYTCCLRSVYDTTHDAHFYVSCAFSVFFAFHHHPLPLQLHWALPMTQMPHKLINWHSNHWKKRWSLLALPSSGQNKANWALTGQSHFQHQLMHGAPTSVLAANQNGSFVAIICCWGSQCTHLVWHGWQVAFELWFCILGVMFGYVGPCVEPKMQAANLRAHNVVHETKMRHDTWFCIMQPGSLPKNSTFSWTQEPNKKWK